MLSDHRYLGIFAVLIAGTAFAEEPTAEGIAFFENKIRPVLVERCYQCHSNAAAEADKLQAGLRLDSRAAAREGGESGPAVIPGNVNDSLLVKAIRHQDFEMPPKSKLPDEVIADFVKWVEMGAPDPRDAAAATPAADTGIDIEAGKQFWAFQPLQQVTPPQVKNTAWVATDVDRFILAALEAKGLSPNPIAAKETLVRRVYFDLWGLPPAPEDVDAFVNDNDDGAFERLVTRLLASDHYGERWARHWLDLARFAESNGYAFDKDRPGAYHYRDFVIRALNDDMPYDQFIRWQIAGDQLEPNNPLAQAATGFLAAGPFTSQQTQKERERSRYEQLDDIIHTMGTATLGMTLGCARCHDHKFDPLPSHDYYRVLAAFAETGFQDFNYDPDPDGTKRAQAAFDAKHKPLVEARVNYERDVLPQRLAEWSRQRTGDSQEVQLSDWSTIGPFAAADFSAAFATAFPPEEEIDLAKSYDQLKWTPQPSWKDGVVHNTLTGDNSANYLFRTLEAAESGLVEVSLGRDDAIKLWLNGKELLAKEVSGAAAADQDIVKLPLKKGKNDLLIKIVNGTGPSGFYFQQKGSDVPGNIQAILDLAADERNAKQTAALLKWFAPRDPEWVKLNQAEQEHKKKQPKPKITKIFAARKGGATYNFGSDTRKVYFLARGNSNAKQGLASPGFLQVLTDADEQHWLGEAENPARPPRVALADWLTDDHYGAGQLLARVIVNRLWQHHLGRGLVATPSDFGHQGARPTHPELLDYLAGELIRGGWNLKPIHQLIMTSSVYRQTGSTHEVAAKVDPYNQLWWHRPAQRLEAEVIRDALLAVSGTLDQRMYGPGSLNEADPRRSVYLTVKRSSLIPFLQLFDAPDAILGVGNRNVTTVPPQALAMMNSPFVRGLAEKFAKRVRPNNTKPLAAVIRDTYRIALGRAPTDAESARMVAFVENQSASYGGGARSLDLAVADLCQMVVCLNEFVFID